MSRRSVMRNLIFAHDMNKLVGVTNTIQYKYQEIPQSITAEQPTAPHLINSINMIERSCKILYVYNWLTHYDETKKMARVKSNFKAILL